MNKKLPGYMLGLINIKCANTRQYMWLYENRCEHRHRYTLHFNCFLKDYEISERVGFVDIETSNLKANFGLMLCWCILSDDNQMYSDTMTAADVKSGDEDKRVVESCIACMKTFDRVCGYYSTYFDIPYIRTRALIHGIPFPEIGSMYHTDVWKMARKVLCLHSNRQAVVAEALYGKTVKTRICHSDWRKAMTGNKKSMDEVLDHCERDVEDLRKNYYTLLPYYKICKSSV